MLGMRVAFTYKIRSFAIGTKEGSQLLVAEALSDPRSFGPKKLDDQAGRKVLKFKWN